MNEFIGLPTYVESFCTNATVFKEPHVVQKNLGYKSLHMTTQSISCFTWDMAIKQVGLLSSPPN